MRHTATGRSFSSAHILLLIVPALALPAAPAGAQEAPPPPPSAMPPLVGVPPPDKAPYRVPRADGPVKVDGVMDELQWQTALKLNLPWEVAPGDNLKASADTDVFLMYDDDHLYAGFKCHDPDASKIRARLSDRDRAFQDDFVGIVVDTFNDRRRAFEFFANALGVQMDLTMDDVNGNEDDSWDAIWSSAGQQNEDGYVVEMAIPYTSLRFQRGEADQLWGLDVVRAYPRDRRYLFALHQRDRNKSCYVCQSDSIVGFAGATPGRNLELVPTVTAKRADTNDDTAANGYESSDSDFDLGGTARWGITPNLTASGAINPDFSQVEADSAQLNVNEQFALFFPEKRPFFLEGADFFETPLRAVYTRTVADPIWGAKLTGKEGRNALGVFAARDEQVNFLFPGSESSSLGALPQGDQATTGVMRYRVDMGKNSTIGALATGRSAGDYSSYLAGADALVRPTPSDSIRVQALYSRTEYSPDLQAQYGVPGGTLSDPAYSFDYRHSKRTWFASARYQNLGPDFRADLGFVPQVGIKQPIIGAGRTWFGDPNTWYARIEVGGDYDQTVDSTGFLMEREWESYVAVQGGLQSYSQLDGGTRLRGFKSELFSQNFVNWYFEFQPNTLLFASIGGGVSDRVDFAFIGANDLDPNNPTPIHQQAARQGFEIRIEPWMRLNLGRRVRAEVFHNLRTLENDGGYLFRANQTQLTLIYQFSLKAFFRAIVQYTDVKYNTDQYQAQCTFDPTLCPSDRSRDMATQLLFSYKINPQSVLFLGYSDSKFGMLSEAQGVTDDTLQPTDRTFFTKVGYAWVF